MQGYSHSAVAQALPFNNPTWPLGLRVDLALRARSMGGKRRLDLTATHIAVISAAKRLLGLWRKSSHIFNASIGQLAAESNLTVPTVITARRELIAMGVFVIEAKGDYGNRIPDDMTISVEATTLDGKEKPKSQRGSKGSRRGPGVQRIASDLKRPHPDDSSLLTPMVPSDLKSFEGLDPRSDGFEKDSERGALTRDPPAGVASLPPETVCPPTPVLPLFHYDPPPASKVTVAAPPPLRAEVDADLASYLEAVELTEPFIEPIAPLTASPLDTQGHHPTIATHSATPTRTPTPPPVARPPAPALVGGQARGGAHEAVKRTAKPSKAPKPARAKKHPRKGPQRGAPIPAAFELTDARRATAKALGLPSRWISDVFGHFVDYHTAQGSPRADWDAAWRVWVRAEISRAERFNEDGLRQARADDRDRERREAAKNAPRPTEPEERKMTNEELDALFRKAFDGMDPPVIMQRPRPR